MDRAARIRNIKVGIAAVVSLVLLAGAYWLVGSFALNVGRFRLNAVFPNVAGIDSGTPVMMAGVKIGQVADITLTDDNRANVRMNIREGLAIPRGSQVRISSVSLLGDKYIEVIPGPEGASPLPEDSTLTGIPSFTLDDLLPQVSTVLARVDDVGLALQDMLTDEGVKGRLESALRNLDLASAAAVGLMNDLRSVTNANRDELNTIAGNLAMASGDIASASEQANRLLGGISPQKVQDVLANLENASANLDRVAVDAANFTGNTKIREDLEASISNARAATEGLTRVINRVGEIVGVDREQTAPVEDRQTPTGGGGAEMDFLFDSERGKARLDVNYNLHLRGDTFYRFGLYDLGENTRLNLQQGRILSDKESLRIGLYQSRLGLGYDWQADDKLLLRTDLYRPNKPRLDVKGSYFLSEDTGVWLGVEDVGSSKWKPMTGLRYKF